MIWLFGYSTDHAWAVILLSI